MQTDCKKKYTALMGKLDLQYHSSQGEQEAEGAAGRMPGRFKGKHSPEANMPLRLGLTLHSGTGT